MLNRSRLSRLFSFGSMLLIGFVVAGCATTDGPVRSGLGDLGEQSGQQLRREHGHERDQPQAGCLWRLHPAYAAQHRDPVISRAARVRWGMRLWNKLDCGGRPRLDASMRTLAIVALALLACASARADAPFPPAIPKPSPPKIPKPPEGPQAPLAEGRDA